MHATRTLIIAVSAALVAAPLIAQADVIYRWVEPNGASAYGNKPPPHARNISRIQDDSRLSIVFSPPGGFRPQEERARVPWSVIPERRPADTIDQAFPGASVSSLRERCYAERRVDCGNPTAATYDYLPAFTPATAGIR
jgi:hypothetical protein